MANLSKPGISTRLVRFIIVSHTPKKVAGLSLFAQSLSPVRAWVIRNGVCQWADGDDQSIGYFKVVYKQSKVTGCEKWPMQDLETRQYRWMREAALHVWS